MRSTNRPTRILFVCTANVCRSPTAEAILNALAEDAGLRVRAESAGVAALEGRGMTSNAVTALDEVGIHPTGHRARQVAREHVENNDLVLVMEPWHIRELHTLLGDLPTEVTTLPGYTVGASAAEGVPDPYGHAMNAHRASVRQLLDYVDLLVKRLVRGGDHV